MKPTIYVRPSRLLDRLPPSAARTPPALARRLHTPSGRWRALVLLLFSGRWRALVSHLSPGAGAPSLFRSPSWGGVVHVFTEGQRTTSCSAECTTRCDIRCDCLRSLARIGCGALHLSRSLKALPCVTHPAGGDCVVASLLFRCGLLSGASVGTGPSSGPAGLYGPDGVAFLGCPPSRGSGRPTFRRTCAWWTPVRNFLASRFPVRMAG